jgi:Alanine dehydrogenase/PNT, C-terminal domain
MLMTAAGTLPPAHVLVLGAGVAGLQAIATARRLGAVVTAFDVRTAVAEQVQSLGAKFLEVEGVEGAEASATPRPPSPTSSPRSTRCSRSARQRDAAVRRRGATCFLRLITPGRSTTPSTCRFPNARSSTPTSPATSSWLPLARMSVTISALSS